MEVAIIDCVLNRNVLSSSIKENIRIKTNFSCDVSNSLMDHSAMVINILEKYTTEFINYHLYEIMDEDNDGTCDDVVEAIEKAICDRVTIIILSLVVIGGDRKRLWNVCEKAKSQNIIIIAAANNDNNLESIPATFSNVIGVKRGIIINYPYCRSCFKNNIQLCGDCTPEFVKGRNERYYLFGGTSKAVPKVIAVIQEAAKINVKKFKELEDYFRTYLPNLTIEKLDFDFYENYSLNDLNKKEVIDILSEVTKKNFEPIGQDVSIFNYLENPKDIDWLLLSVFEKFNLEVDLLNVNYFDISTIWHLCRFITRMQESQL